MYLITEETFKHVNCETEEVLTDEELRWLREDRATYSIAGTIQSSQEYRTVDLREEIHAPRSGMRMLLDSAQQMVARRLYALQKAHEQHKLADSEYTRQRAVWRRIFTTLVSEDFELWNEEFKEDFEVHVGKPAATETDSDPTA